MSEDVTMLNRVIKSRFMDKVMKLLPSGGNLNLCLTCGACSAGCPATGLDGLDPRKFFFAHRRKISLSWWGMSWKSTGKHNLNLPICRRRSIERAPNSFWNKDLKIKFTVQDPCQIVRKSYGDPIADDLRFVVKTVVGEENFIDMQPSRRTQ